MGEADHTAPVWRFGGRELHEGSLELSVDGRVVAIERKPLEVLLALLRNAGDVVTKDELLTAVWPGRVLSDSVLARAVALLRKAIGDDDQVLVKTVHGYGYRLAVPVERVVSPSPGLALLGLKAGDSPANRPHFKLQSRFGASGSSEVWLSRHEKTGESRVFKFALDGAQLQALKREVTINRLLRDAASDLVGVMPILDWNFEAAPFYIEMAYLPAGNLGDWLTAQGDAVPLPQRLELIAQVADTLAAAHAVGVLHKDLKPGNILIDDRGAAPEPLLADFGSGRVLQPDRLDQLHITRLGITQTQLIPDSTSGTPLYLAPEIMAGQLPTQQSDLYALGVVLYQTVVGDFRRPFGGGWETDIADEVLREDIAAASNVSPQRRMTGARELADRLRSLDMRRSEREAQRAQQFAIARERVALDRARARRSWMLAAMAALVIGLIGSSLLYLQADRARKRADTEAATARALNTFLIDDVLAAADVSIGGNADVSLREILDRAANSVDTRLDAQPEVQMAVRAALGRAYASLDDLRRAQELLAPALAEARGRYGEQDPRTLDLKEYNAYAMQGQGRWKEADALLAEVEKARLSSMSDADSRVLRVRSARAAIVFDRGDKQSGRAQLQSVLDKAATAPTPDPSLIAELKLYAAQLDERLGQRTSAERTLRALVTDLTTQYGPRHSRTLSARMYHGLMLRDMDQATAAEKELLAVRDDMVSEYGPDYFMVGPLLSEIATTYVRQGRGAEAAALYPQNFPQTLYMRSGYLDDAVELQKALLDQAERTEGATSLAALALRCRLGDVYRRMKRFDLARPLLETARDQGSHLLAADHPVQVRVLAAVGMLDVASGRDAQARTELSEVLPVMVRSFGKDDPQVKEVQNALAKLQRA